ncbi:hypothetical protein HOG17_05135 [Candidatus Peregrinibacteria bacterium]|jgi:hypothetical protein|nr:hypothetical protein [Candidatus Peregrinibacteria bacterium]MBT4148201.1 hypothetical protein [Candidatus Peregrinibacteria bacterium]MBT4366028.1 hypothetical protein [Candidatus Peregrinibacteria bacterium]MBT4455687.1 hypothetical protein [Candidatus Peregrinibacteria bacterium]
MLEKFEHKDQPKKAPKKRRRAPKPLIQKEKEAEDRKQEEEATDKLLEELYDPEEAPGPFEAAKMLEEAYEQLNNQLVEEFYYKGLDAPSVGLTILRAKQNSKWFGEMYGGKPRKDVKALVQEWMDKKKDEILNNKEFWKE